jgi:poly(beta-D-mannuronate) lyase
MNTNANTNPNQHTHEPRLTTNVILAAGLSAAAVIKIISEASSESNVDSQSFDGESEVSPSESDPIPAEPKAIPAESEPSPTEPDSPDGARRNPQDCRLYDGNRGRYALLEMLKKQMFRTTLASFAAVLGILTSGSTGGVAYAREQLVSTAAEISRLASDLQPGDVLVFSNGDWRNQPITFKARGTAENPVTLRAHTPGKVTFTGESSLKVDGEFVVVSGFRLHDATAKDPAILVLGNNCRVTECAVEGGMHKFQLQMRGISNRVDHCYFAEKTNGDPTFQIEVEGRPNYHRVDHNLFGRRPPLGQNGGETMRVGYSHQSMTNSRTLVELNLFEQCDGELEIISNKSCENTYRNNTFLDCAGMFTLRHGNRCVVDGNVIVAHGKKGSGGIRVIGEDHKVINNYIDGVAMGGFWITSGIPDSELKGYFQAKNCLIANNTFVNSPGPAMQLDAGIGSSRRTLRPENITVVSNIFSITSGQLFKGTEGAGWKWEGNLTNSVGTVKPPKLLSHDEVGPSWLRPR